MSYLSVLVGLLSAVVFGVTEWISYQTKLKQYNNKFNAFSSSYKYKSYYPNKLNNIVILSTTALGYDRHKYDVIISDCTDSHYTNSESSSTYTTAKILTTSTTNDDNKNNGNDTSHHFCIFKLISLYLIITKSCSSREFTKEPKEKQHHHHQQQQQHYHGKHRHQFHLEQQQKHQHFKQEYRNVERMAAFIVLKLTLVAWDMWTYRNGF